MDELHTEQLNRIYPVPPFLYGKEPTILDILKFVKDDLIAKQSIVTQSELNQEAILSIKDNILKIENSWSFKDGYFYLYGQIKTDNQIKVTNKILKYAIQYNYKRLIEVPPMNNQDSLSLKRELEIFNSLLTVFKIYYNYKTEIHYAPGGEGYLEAKSHFEEMVKKIDSDNSIVAEEKASICSFCLFN